MRVDGLPLAIELAAARMKLFSPQALLKRLTVANSRTSTRFLKSNTRDVAGRHRSLRDTIAWSHALLDQDEQMFFRRLAVFVGGWTLEAAATVCFNGENSSHPILDMVAALVDKHLVLCLEGGNGEPRFTMLETIREFGLEQLQLGNELRDLQYRHARHYLRLAETANQYLEDADQDQWLYRLDQEHNNLRAALVWATTQQEVELSLHLAAARPRYWQRRGHHEEAYGRLRNLLQKFSSNALPSPVEDVLFYAGIFGVYRDKVEVYKGYFTQAADASRRVGNKYRLSYALALLGEVTFNQGEFAESKKFETESLALAREVGDTFGVAIELINQGRYLALCGEPTAGRKACEEGLSLHRQLGDKWGLMVALKCISTVALVQGCYAEARAHCEEALQLAHQLDSDVDIASAQHHLALVYLETADWDATHKWLHRSLRLLAEHVGTKIQIDSLIAFARLAAAQRQPARALCLASASITIQGRQDLVLPPVIQAQFDAMVASVRRQLDEETAASTWFEGEAMALDEAVAFALGCRALPAI